MKVIKPQKLGVLCRTFEYRKDCYFSAAILVFFPLDAPRSLLPEIEMWKTAAEELGKDVMLDACMPKPRGEVLVAGKAFASGGKPRTAVQVRVKVGTIDKTLLVVGDRHWKPGLFGGSSEPRPFTEMPITWEQAFGGEGFAQNPLGKGFAPITIDGGQIQLLPNIEDPKKPVASPQDRPAPAGFGAIDQTWPQRASKVGTYDRRWLDESFPGLADDLDLGFFNMALADQQMEGHYKGDEAFRIENMNASEPVIEGSLPGAVTRCFITRKTDEGETFVEIATRLDTVWLLPGARKGVLVYHGMTKIQEHDGADVLHLVAACEDPAAPRPVEHYREVLAGRLDKKRGVLLALRDQDLMPAWAAELVDHSKNEEMKAVGGFENLMRKNARRRAEREFTERRAYLVTLGLDPDEHGPPALPPEEDDDPYGDPTALAALAERTIEDAKALETKERGLHEEREKDLRRVFAENGLDFEDIVKERTEVAGGPPTFTAEGKMAELRATAEQCRAAGTPIDEIEQMVQDPVLWERYRENERQLRAAYLLTAHHGSPAALLEGDAALRARVVVVAAHAGGQSLSGTDFTGADLSELDLRGVDFSGAFLERVNFHGSDLRGADLSCAVLSRAKLTQAKLDGAKLECANLGKAELAGVEAGGGADFTRAILSGADFTGADLRGAILTEADLTEVTLLGSKLAGIRAERLTFFKSKLAGVDFAGAQIPRTNFLETDVSRADFTGADLTAAVFMDATADGAVFRSATLVKLRTVAGCSFAGADFTGARLDGSTLRGCRFAEANFTDAILDHADLSESDLHKATLLRASAKEARFVRADLSDAVMTSTNLMSAILQRAKLAGTDLRGANLYEADVSRVRGDKRTSFEGANLKRANTKPLGSAS